MTSTAAAARARKFGMGVRSPRQSTKRSVARLEAVCKKLGLTKEEFIAQYITHSKPVAKPQD